MNQIIACLLVVSACSSSEVHTVIGEEQSFDAAMKEWCVMSPGESWSVNDYSDPEKSSFHLHQRCILRSADGNTAGPMPFEVHGNPPGFCFVQFGPAPIWRALDLKRIPNLVSNNRVRNNLERLLKPLDPNREFEITGTYDGVSFQIRQFISGYDGPSFFLRIDGCHKIDTTRMRTNISGGPLLKFAGGPVVPLNF